MIVEYRIFTWLSAFFFVMTGIYAFLTIKFQTGGIEWSGTVALFLTGGLSILIGGYFRLISRRLEKLRPEDDPNATVEDNPEELGFFSPGSIWPITVAGAVALAGVSFALKYFWMIFPAGILLILAAAGLVFEYHKAPEKH